MCGSSAENRSVYARACTWRGMWDGTSGQRHAPLWAKGPGAVCRGFWEAWCPPRPGARSTLTAGPPGRLWGSLSLFDRGLVLPCPPQRVWPYQDHVARGDVHVGLDGLF